MSENRFHASLFEANTETRLDNSTSSAAPWLLTYRQAADVMQISERSVWSLVQARRLPAVRLGRAVRIDRRDLVAFIDGVKKGQ